MARLKKGDSAPVIRLLDQNGNEQNLIDSRGEKMLVFFYPRAMTSGCTLQAQSVRDAKKQLAKLGVRVMGISPDTPDKQKKFDDKYGLGYPLLSDTEHTAAESFGVWGEKTVMGKKTEGIIRSSFLIDENGRVMDSWYKVKPEDTVPKAIEALKKK